MTDTENPVGLRIRPAQISEAEALTQLAMDSKAHWNYTPQQLAIWRNELTVQPVAIQEGRAYVGEIDHTPVAVMVLSPAPIKWKLSHLFVGPKWMKQGIGKAMFECAIDVARKQGARAVVIDADPNSEPFYLACGAVRSYAINAPIEQDSNRIRPQMLFSIPSRKAGLPA